MQELEKELGATFTVGEWHANKQTFDFTADMHKFRTFDLKTIAKNIYLNIFFLYFAA